VEYILSHVPSISIIEKSKRHKNLLIFDEVTDTIKLDRFYGAWCTLTYNAQIN